MRSLIISVISVGILISGWCIFVNYADKNIHQLIDAIEDDITVSVYDGEWEKASDSFEQLSDKWHKNKKVYSFFFDTGAIIDTDFSIARAKSYIATKDLPLAAGELSCIKEQLGFLHLNELITLENIF